MRTAIDRYSVGVEKEVNADEFDGIYIPGRLNRFFCPECGEIVYFRSKGGYQPNHFYHKEKTDSTPECDKRVDGRSDLSLSQRVGLPIFLSRIGTNHFQLNIGFPALGKEMLQKASQANAVVKISADNQHREIRIDQTNFIEDAITIIPINFIPSYGLNYRIRITKDTYVYGLDRKWSDYADGFENAGALFTYEETGGKKVRRGDAISVSRDYYLLTRYKPPEDEHIVTKGIGSMTIGSINYSIYHFKVEVSVDDSFGYNNVSNLLKRKYGVWLLEKQPELIPLWPPVVEQETMIPIKQDTPVYCAVSSGNDTPNVFMYSDYGASAKKIDGKLNNISIVSFTVGLKPVTLSVDRKYVGREVSFQNKKIYHPEYEYSITMGHDGKEYSIDAIIDLLQSKPLIIRTNSKFEVYTGTRNKTYRHISIRENETILQPIASTREILFVVQNCVFLHGEGKDSSKEDSRLNDANLISEITKRSSGQLVPIPQWAQNYIRKAATENRRKVYRALCSSIRNGRIFVSVLMLLQKQQYMEISD